MAMAYEIRKLKRGAMHRPLGLTDLKALLDAEPVGDLSELADMPIECTSLSEVAGMLAQPTEQQTLETAIDELHDHLQTAMSAEGIARHGDFVIREVRHGT